MGDDMKSKFVKSTIILIIGGFITKILGMVIKIVMTRLIGTEGIGIYMLISPTFMLLIALAQLGLPTAISKIVAENKVKSKNLVFSIIPISLIINLVIIIFMLFASSFIANNLLHEPRSYYALICTGLVLPFISISSILRGYFFGKQRMIPHVVSNVTEDIVRLVIIALGLPIFLSKGIEMAIAFIVLSNIFSELTSIFVLFFFIPKGFKLEKDDFIPNNKNIKNILNIALPTTSSRLIGNIGHFFEPIILTTLLIKTGYSNAFLVREYGIINGYVLPLILLPSFFTLAISQALLPIVSNNYSNGNKEQTKRKIKQAIFFSLLIGIPATIIFEFFPDFLLKFIYNTNEGISYIKALAPICLLHYIQSPISSSLQAMGKAKDSMKGTLYGMLLRTLILSILCLFKIGLWSLIITIAFNIVFVTIYDYRKVKKYLK